MDILCRRITIIIKHVSAVGCWYRHSWIISSLEGTGLNPGFLTGDLGVAVNLIVNVSLGAFVSRSPDLLVLKVSASACPAR